MIVFYTTPVDVTPQPNLSSLGSRSQRMPGEWDERNAAQNLAVHAYRRLLSRGFSPQL